MEAGYLNRVLQQGKSINDSAVFNIITGLLKNCYS
jgi:hypothetical protein